MALSPIQHHTFSTVSCVFNLLSLDICIGRDANTDKGHKSEHTFLGL